MPPRAVPLIGGALVIVLALPIFLIAGWDLAGWALGAVLWGAAQLVGFVLARLSIGPGKLAASSVVGIGMTFRAVAVMVVVIAVAASDAGLGLAAALVYGLAYTLELALSLAGYFGTETA